MILSEFLLRYTHANGSICYFYVSHLTLGATPALAIHLAPLSSQSEIPKSSDQVRLTYIIFARHIFDHRLRCFWGKALAFVMLGVLFTSSFTRGAGTSGEPAALINRNEFRRFHAGKSSASTQQPTLHPPILPRSIKS